MNDGGPAFPVTCSTGDPRDGVYSRDGMSLRDWFAGQALAGVTSWRAVNEIDAQQSIATACYELADAMLAERAKEKAQ